MTTTNKMTVPVLLLVKEQPEIYHGEATGRTVYRASSSLNESPSPAWASVLGRGDTREEAVADWTRRANADGHDVEGHDAAIDEAKATTKTKTKMTTRTIKGNNAGGTARLYSTAEIQVRTVQETMTDAPTMMNRPELAAQWFREVVMRSEWWDADKEHFVVANLNRKNRLKNWALVTVGTQTQALAHPREVFRAAVVGCAAAVVCFHNHPSGDPAPSAADVQITRLLREASVTLDIQLMDHVIVGDAPTDPMGRGFYSFREQGVL